ncbi:MAG TPA: hypothetical protein VFJ52_14270 [Terriglobia bacterium]|nr:hypothetical protein [Terriglobia bacterium]
MRDADVWFGNLMALDGEKAEWGPGPKYNSLRGEGRQAAGSGDATSSAISTNKWAEARNSNRAVSLKATEPYTAHGCPTV